MCAGSFALGAHDSARLRSLKKDSKWDWRSKKSRCMRLAHCPCACSSAAGRTRIRVRLKRSCVCEEDGVRGVWAANVHTPSLHPRPCFAMVRTRSPCLDTVDTQSAPTRKLLRRLSRLMRLLLDT
jgi:hypothetical protein